MTIMQFPFFLPSLRSVKEVYMANPINVLVIFFPKYQRAFCKGYTLQN